MHVSNIFYYIIAQGKAEGQKWFNSHKFLYMSYYHWYMNNHKRLTFGRNAWDRQIAFEWFYAGK